MGYWLYMATVWAVVGISVYIDSAMAYPTYCEKHNLHTFGNYYQPQYIYCEGGCCYGSGSSDDSICCAYSTMDVGMIVGIVFGALFGVVCLTAFVCCCIHMCKKSTATGVIISTAPNPNAAFIGHPGNPGSGYQQPYGQVYPTSTMLQAQSNVTALPI